ncbi:uncharacterized protein STEHIDRAFT_160399 [Stereum hirsutum FP-91666 SS1]|uniref:uncharacterized protein n=1 Tax=Stereum hirsutum (strain FP-91666) TaxID=721885 RepID=UPI000444A82C|nr:uncharacterized protein STEHIDRAFT_160399 [Stereum hirsutum FP-91666 SS1]EIM82772.1 hypothetical protein STEHIDRAFT_160399 [Stereum hirsutum FP-91666 SS1]
MSNCSAEEWFISVQDQNNGYSSLSCLTTGQSIGLTVIAEASTLSVLAIFVLFGFIIRNVYRHSRYSRGQWSLVQEPTDIYMLSLFTFDLIQAIGSVMDMKWVNEGKTYKGSYCTAQGVIQELGETGVAITTIIIAVHTFVGVFWRIGTKNRTVAFTLVGMVWLFVALLVGISSGIHNDPNNLYVTPTPYWCWIAQEFKGERIAGEYLWLWIALFTSILVYVPLFLWSQGMLSVDTSQWWRYPFVYSIVTLPLSVVRWIGFGLESHGSKVPSAATFVAASLYGLSGFLNVLLILLTRPQLLLFGPPITRTARGRAPSPSPAPPRRVYKAPESSMALGVLNDDNGWDLDRRSVASSYISSTPHPHLTGEAL